MPSFWSEREDLGRKAFPPPLPHKLESLRGPGYSNIIFRGFALAGAHPGNSTSELVANLTPLLRAGVTTFVCLQHELPSAGHTLAHQRSQYANTNVVTAKNYLPDAQAIIDSGGFPQVGGPPLSFLHLPISDLNGSTVPDDVLKPFVLDLIAHMKAGEYLYIQCGDGNGRTGTLTALLLGLVYNLSSSEALDLAQRSRTDRPGTYGVSPETHEQKMQVHRLLADKSFRDAAARVSARHSNSVATDASARLEATVKKIKAVLCKKGIMSLIYLRRYAQTLVSLPSTSSPDPSLDWHGFNRLAADSEWYLTTEEMDSLWNAARAEGPAVPRSGTETPHFGAVSIHQLFRIIRGTMNARRAAAVHESFKRLSFSTGFTTMEMLAAAFHPETHPDVRAGRRTAAAVKDEFYDTFGIGTRDSNTRRQISAAEFEDYYADISAAVDDDAYFEIMVFGCWPTAEGTTRTSGKTMASRVAASTAAATAPTKPATPSLLIEAYLTTQGGAAALASVVAHTEHGYSYIDFSNPANAIRAFRQYLASRSDFMIALVGSMLRRNDTRRDGQVDIYEFKQALKDAGLSMPDVDVETAFLGLASAVYNIPVVELALDKTLLPIEDAHSLLREPLSDAKRSVVLSIFNAFDSEGSGAIPVAKLVLAFKAESYPPVETGKISPHIVYKQFQDSFAEGFALIDKAGPAARARGLGSLPARAYYGLGDGLVRFTYFEEFHESLAASIPDDGAFALVVAKIWSGGGLRRAQKASLDPHTVAQRADVYEDGFLSNMERLSMNHPYEPAPTSNSGGIAKRSFAHKGDSAIGTSLARPPSHASASSPGGAPRSAPATPARHDDYSLERGGRRHNNALDTALKYTSSPSIFTGGDGMTGQTASALRGSPRYTTGPGLAPVEPVRVGEVGDSEVDNSLRTVRDVLFKRGTKSIFALVHSLEDAAASFDPSHVGDIHAPMPASAFAVVLRDCSFGLSPRQLDALVSFVESRSRCGARAVIPYVFLTLIRGQLNATRADVVQKAYHHITRKVMRAPTLDDIRMMYKSASHPDVIGRKRSEETVLREFLETFAGSTYVDPYGNVSLEGFMEYFNNLAFYFADDLHFTVLMFDTWALAKDEIHDLAAGNAAGRPSGLDASSIPTREGSPASTYGRWQRGGTLVLGEDAGPTDFRPGFKGHGLERLGYGYQSR